MSFAAVATDRVIPGAKTPRGTIVPEFYKPHQNLDVQVAFGGVLMGFKIEDVAPERRWAVHPDGAVLDQSTFARYYEQILSIGAVGPTDACHMPAVDDYVAKSVDPVNEARFRRLNRIDKTGKRAPLRNDGPIVDPAFARRANLTVATETQVNREMLTEEALEATESAFDAAESPDGDAFTCDDCDRSFPSYHSRANHKRHCKGAAEASD